MKSRTVRILVVLGMILTSFGGICEVLCATTMSGSMHGGHHECAGGLCPVCAATGGCSMSAGPAAMTFSVAGSLPDLPSMFVDLPEADVPPPDARAFESMVVRPPDQPPRA